MGDTISHNFMPHGELWYKFVASYMFLTLLIMCYCVYMPTFFFFFTIFKLINFNWILFIFIIDIFFFWINLTFFLHIINNMWIWLWKFSFLSLYLCIKWIQMSELWENMKFSMVLDGACREARKLMTISSKVDVLRKLLALLTS